MLKVKILNILFKTLFFLGVVLIVVFMLSQVLLSDTLTLLEKMGAIGILLLGIGCTGMLVRSDC